MLTLRKSTHPKLAGILAAALLALVSPSTQAATFNWTNVIGDWSNGAFWGGTAPTGTGSTAPTDILNFGGDVAPLTLYTSTNNSLTFPFTINQIVSNATDATVPPTTNAHIIDGNTLRFAGANAQIAVNGAGGLTLENNIQLGANLIFGGSGAGVATLNGGISGYADITKSGASIFRFGTPATLVASDNFWLGKLNLTGGTVRFNNNAQSGPTAIRANPVVLSAGALLTARRNDNDQAAGYFNSLRMGTLSGTGGAVTATVESATFGDVDNYDIIITALSDGVYAGTLTLPAPLGLGNNGGALVVRGTKTQTLSGIISINKDVIVGQGASLKLAGSATLGSQTAGAVTFAGGSLLLDNSGGNATNGRLRDGNAIQTTIEVIGGGTLSLIGNTAAGTTELTGRLMLGTFSAFLGETKPRSGQLDVRLTHPSTTQPTVLSFQSYSRDESTAPQLNTVDFTAVNAAGTPLTLGNPGATPRVLLTTNVANFAVPLSGNLLSATAGSTSTGWATVAGADFATYDAVNGVKAVATVPWTGSLLNSDNALLTANSTTPFTTYSVNSLKMAPTAANLSLDITGASSFSASGFLLVGANNLSITSTGGGGIAGNSPRFIAVQTAATKLTISARVDAAQQPIVKFGAGILELTNIQNVNLTATTAINAGTLRATPGTSLPGGEIQLRGGILELKGGGTFSRTLGNGADSINWSGVRFNGTIYESVDEDRGSGGFAARDANIAVDLAPIGPTDIRWEDLGFVRSGYALIFGSATATHRVTFKDNLNLTEDNATAINYNARQVRVLDNPAVATDYATLSGILSGASYNDLLKTGPGTLELSNHNTYLGGTLIHEGTLLITGNNSTTAYNDVQPGATLAGDGTAGPILLETGGFIRPGNNGVGTLTTSRLTVRSGSTFFYDLTPSAVSDKIVVNGPLEKGSTAGANPIINFGGTGEGGRSYPLITYTSTSTPAFTAADFTVAGLPAGLTGALTITGPVAGVSTLNYVFNFPVPLVTAQPPATQRITLGEPATFTITANSTLFGFQWKKGATVLAGNGATTPTFTIPAVSDADAGSYTCVVTRVSPAATATSNASVLTINHRSTPTAQTVPVGENVAKVITLAGTDPDVGDAAILTYTIVTPPTNGTLSAVTGAKITYTPGTNYSGPDSFTFKTNDGLADSTVTATVTLNVSLVNSAPVAVNDTAALTGTSVIVPVKGNDSDPDAGDTFSVTAVTQGAHGTVTFTGTSVTYTPGASFITGDTFTYTLTDNHGASDAGSIGTVTITLGKVAAYGIASKGLGTTVPGGMAGDTFKLFGQPSLALDGRLAYTATYTDVAKKLHRGIFAGNPATLVIKETDTAEGTTLKHAKFGDPAMNSVGHLAYKATLLKAPAGTNEGIWARTSAGVNRLVVRGKMPVPGVSGATLVKPLDFALPDDGRVVFTAKLAGVPATTNFGIFREDGMGSFTPVLRTGDTLGKVIKTLSIFGPVPLSPGQQRGFNATGQLLVRVTFVDKTSSLVLVNANNSNAILLSTGVAHPELGGASIKSFNLPVLTDAGDLTVTATLLTTAGGPTAANKTVLLHRTSAGTLTLRARTGTLLANPSQPQGTTPSKLGDILGSDTGRTFFTGTLKSVPGFVTPANNLVLWRTDNTGTLNILARKGSAAPGIMGGIHKTFTSLAYAGSGLRGPAFVGTVATNKTALITAANDSGLWVVDSTGALKLALREGNTTVAFGPSSIKTLKSFTVLAAALGSPSQGRSYNDGGGFAVLATFTDKTSGILTVWVP